jgi:hypothetical protein
MSTSPITLFKVGIKEALETNANVGSYVNKRIHHYAAPVGETVPFVEYRFTTGGWVRRDARGHVNVVYEVYGVHTDETKAVELAGAIHDCLTGHPLPLGGWDNFATIAEDWSIDRFFDSEGNLYYKVGEMYEFRAVRRG